MIVLTHLQAFYSIFAWKSKSIQLNKDILIEDPLTTFSIPNYRCLRNLPVPRMLPDALHSRSLIWISRKELINYILNQLRDKLWRCIFSIQNFTV